MMSNSKKIIKIDLDDFMRVTKTPKADLFYKNGNLKKSGKAIVNNWLVKVMIGMIDLDRTVEGAETDFYRHYVDATLEVCSIRGDIRIIYDWEKMKFNNRSPYYNVYDFQNHYDKLLNEVTLYIMEKHSIIALIY